MNLGFVNSDTRIATANGIRVFLVATRKGGAGKSTFCRALASAAVARGETVTLFDTDPSRSCRDWMDRAQASGTWSPLIEVIASQDASMIQDAITEIQTQPDQEHLILIDTAAGRSQVADQLLSAAQHVICPAILSRGDFNETRATATWYLAMTQRLADPVLAPPFSVALSRVPLRISETERSVAADLFAALPVFENFIASRISYVRMDEAGLLGSLAATLPNRAVASHLATALAEADTLLSEIDAAIRSKSPAA